MIIDQWTGRHASLLRQALRMTVEGYAHHLGVATRTVAKWEADPDIRPRADMQQVLDTAYDRAGAGARERFAALLDTPQARQGEPQGLYAALAIVRRRRSVLLVHRRDGDTLRWQFPAGVVKPGADAAAVAVRETLAETGVHCTVAREVGQRTHPVTGVWCVYYLCEYLAGDAENLDPVENVSTAWAPITELTRFIPEPAIYPPVLTALRETMTEDHPTIAAAVIVQDGRLLLIRRRHAEGSLSWQFPAGAVEPGESAEEAAARETREEVGLSVAPSRLLGERVHPKTGRRMAYVACDVKGGEAHVADAEEIAEVAWVASGEVTQYVPYGFAPMVQEYLTEALPRPDL